MIELPLPLDRCGARVPPSGRPGCRRHRPERVAARQHARQSQYRRHRTCQHPPAWAPVGPPCHDWPDSRGCGRAGEVLATNLPLGAGPEIITFARSEGLEPPTF